jgi:hypothetical protein
MDNPEKTKRTFKNGQSRENQKDIQEWTIQRKPKGHSRMDNPGTLATLGIQRYGTKKNKTQHNTELKTIKN